VLGIAHSSSLVGATGLEVRIEAFVSKGIPVFVTVGLPDSVVRESRVRIEAALKELTKDLMQRRVVINLAPADLRKEGSALDLAMAVATLVGLEQIKPEVVASLAFIGELGLDGSLRPVPGAILHARSAKEHGRALVLPQANAQEAALITGLTVHPIDTLAQLVGLLARGAPLPVAQEMLLAVPEETVSCFSDVRGQDTAKRALLLAAVGGHHVLLHGIPGVGKTMLCERFVGLLPDLDEAQELEVLSMTSLSSHPVRMKRPPFRAPHHSLSMAALVGGGSVPRPGEISLAHHGVLFLDELGEFRAEAINALRQPLESGRISIARSQRSLSFDASFQLLAATNPCPCGNFNHPTRRCSCSQQALERYRAKLGGPIADRFDMSIAMLNAPSSQAGVGEKSMTLRERVKAARSFAGSQGRCGLNRTLGGNEVLKDTTREATLLLRQAQTVLGLSGRAVDRVLRVARSAADLEESHRVSDLHVCEAIALRHEAAGEAHPPPPFIDASTPL
jgi:magnesium chelatase family protein